MRVLDFRAAGTEDDDSEEGLTPDSPPISLE